MRAGCPGRRSRCAARSAGRLRSRAAGSAGWAAAAAGRRRPGSRTHGLGPQQRPAQSQPAVAFAVMFQHGGSAQRLDVLQRCRPTCQLRRCSAKSPASAPRSPAPPPRPGAQHPGQPPARAGLAAQRPGRHRQQGDGQQGQQPAQDRPAGPPGRCGLSRRCSAGSARWRLASEGQPHREVQAHAVRSLAVGQVDAQRTHRLRQRTPFTP